MRHVRSRIFHRFAGNFTVYRLPETRIGLLGWADLGLTDGIWLAQDAGSLMAGDIP
jgi:hypothetical protein